MTPQDSKNRTETGQRISCPVLRQARKLPKTHKNFWLQRLKKRSYRHQGELRQLPNYQVRLFHLRREHWFDLATANQEAAAGKAKAIHQFLLVNGWEATLAKFKPKAEPEASLLNVGGFLDSVKANGDLRLVTFEIYAKKFRGLVASIFGIRAGREKFDYVGGGRNQWVEKINKIRIARITPQKVEAWKMRVLKEAERKNPQAHRHATVTLGSILKSAAALFSPKILKRLPAPVPNPFQGVASPRVERRKFHAEITAGALIAAANRELKAEHPESFKIFLLALTMGLRRDEIDTLEWRQFNWEHRTLSIETTIYTSAKSHGSEKPVRFSETVGNVLKEFKAQSKSQFVIASDIAPRPLATSYHHYRCTRQFEHLIEWLRGKGLDTRTPLHDLRKLFGSEVARKYGIYAASLALRHSGITITRDYYTDGEAQVEEWEELSTEEKLPEQKARA